MDSPGADPDIFRLRSYQAEMVEESLKQNIIVAMDTGSGKTHIAISRTAAELETCDPDQLVWFIAPTVTLCHQQACLFEKHLLQYQLRFLSGNDNVDRWSDQAIWDAVLENVRVVVSTPAVLLDTLTHGFVKLTKIALLIFDEAHMCRGNHPASAIMQKFYHPLLLDGHGDHLPKILGLTASPVVSANPDGLEIIERSLNAIAKTPKRHRTELLLFTHRPELIQLKYSSSNHSEQPPILAALAAAYHGYDILADPYIVSLRKKAAEATDETRDNLQRSLQKLLTNRKTYIHEQLKKLYSRALAIYNDIGEPATKFYIRSCIAKFNAFLANSSHMLFDWSEDEGNSLRDTLSLVAASQPINQAVDMDQNLSPKMYALIDLLLAEARDDFTGIIFVEQRATVAVMDHVLSKHPQLQKLFNVGTFVGTSMTTHRKSHLGIGDLVEVKHQQQTLDDFRAGKKNLIVATSVLEEGIDVSNCHIVICYEPPKNLKSFIQRRGRARKQDSKFVIMFPDDDPLAKSPDRWLDLEEQMKEAYLNDLREVQAATEREQLEEEGDAIYRCESTGALLTLDNAMQHLYHFCAILGGGQHVDLRPRFSFAEVSGNLMTATVTLPTSVSAKVRQHRGVGGWLTERAARKDAAFQAYVALHKAGLVNDNLLPLLSDAQDEPEFGIVEKTPSMIQVDSRLDPWVPVATAMSTLAPSMLWYRTKLSVSLDGQLVSFVLLFPRPTPKVPDFLLHWNHEVKYVLTSEPMDPVHLNTDKVMQLQRSTRSLLYSVFGTRMVEERFDFLYLVAPYDVSGEGLATDGMRPALEVYEELQAGLNPTIGIVHPRGLEGQLLTFRGFQIVDVDMTSDAPEEPAENGEKSPVHLVYSKFPKRRDFLHPIRDFTQQSMYSKEHMLPAKDVVINTLPASYSIFAAFLPSILHRYELFMIVQELCNTVVKPIGFTDHELLLRAITTSATNELDYQRLEFLGDTILKFSTAVQLMAQHLHWPESYLTERKDRIVSNGALSKASRRAGLDKFIYTKAFTGTKWRPRYVRDILSQSPPAERPLSTKTLADVVESLIGAAYVEGGLPKANLTLTTLLPTVPWATLPSSRRTLAASASADYSTSSPPHVERVEALIGYTFTNKHLLLEALTHPSYLSPRESTATSSYQRLEFLGDAVLDYLVSRRLHAHRRPTNIPGTRTPFTNPHGHAPDELPHWTMHTIRAALVNASFLAFLCMDATVDEPVGPPPASFSGEQATTPPPPRKLALYHFMRHTAPTLPAALAATAARHAAHAPAVHAALRSAPRYPWPLLARIGAEKFFSDLVEAVLGAIFVDSIAKDGDADDDADDDLRACEQFLERLGLMAVLERVVADGVGVLHPKSEVGLMAGEQGRLGWGWDEGDADDNVDTAVVDDQQGDDARRGGKGKGMVRCRVRVGERWVGDWVEGMSRADAETEAAERAVLILRAEGVGGRSRELPMGVVGGDDGEEVGGAGGAGGAGGEEEEEEEEKEEEKEEEVEEEDGAEQTAVSGAEVDGLDVVMGDA